MFATAHLRRLSDDTVSYINRFLCVCVIWLFMKFLSLVISKCFGFFFFPLAALVPKNLDSFVICYPSPSHVVMAFNLMSKSSSGCGCLVSGFSQSCRRTIMNCH